MIRDKCLNGTYWWFKHDENVTNETNETKSFENGEVGKKIFPFMEKMDKKLNELEQKNISQN